MVCAADRLRTVGSRYLGEGGREELCGPDQGPERGGDAWRSRLGDHRGRCSCPRSRLPRLLRCHS